MRNKRMKVMVVNLPWLNEFGETTSAVKSGSRWPHFSSQDCNVGLIPPIFLGTLLNILSQDKSLEVLFVDAIAEGLTEREFLQRISDESPDVFITEISTPSLYSDLYFIKRVKEVCGAIIIVCGTHATSNPEDVKIADIIVRGEFEQTVSEVVQELKKGGTPPKIVNTEKLMDLSKCPFPAWDKMPTEKYIVRGAHWSGESRELEIMTSRGCPFRCIFCLWPQVFYNHRVRYFDPDRVVDHLEFLVNTYNLTGFYFNDDTFTLNKKHVLAICKGILKKNLHIHWACFGHCATVDFEMLQIMKEAGCRKIKYGVESGSQKILDQIGKKLTVPAIERAVELTRKANIQVHTSYTIGYPDDSFETILETINLAKRLKPDSYVVSIATPFPGTEFYEQVIREGLLVQHSWNQYRGNQISTVRTKYLSADDLIVLKNYFDNEMSLLTWKNSISINKLLKTSTFQLAWKGFKKLTHYYKVRAETSRIFHYRKKD